MWERGLVLARRKVAYRKQRQNRFSMFLVSIVVLLVLVAVSVRSMELQEKLDTYTAKENQLSEQIAAEEERSSEIEEYRKYTQTKKFAEEYAKEKLGLVYKDEILFKQED